MMALLNLRYRFFYVVDEDADDDGTDCECER